MKICVKCNQPKQLSEYNSKKSWCKACKSAYNKQYRLDNLERIHNNRQKSKLVNKEAKLLVRKAYSEKNKDRINELRRLSYSNHKDACIARSRTWYSNNKEQAQAKSKEYREANKEHLLLKRKEWVASENGQASMKAYSGRRRNNKRNTDDGSITISSLKELLSIQNNKCYHCGCSLDKTKHLDHYIPLSKGGGHIISNVVWSCASCNLKKNSKLPTQLLLL